MKQLYRINNFIVFEVEPKIATKGWLDKFPIEKGEKIYQVINEPTHFWKWVNPEKIPDEEVALMMLKK